MRPRHIPTDQDQSVARNDQLYKQGYLKGNPTDNPNLVLPPKDKFSPQATRHQKLQHVAGHPFLHSPAIAHMFPGLGITPQPAFPMAPLPGYNFYPHGAPPMYPYSAPQAYSGYPSYPPAPADPAYSPYSVVPLWPGDVTTPSPQITSTPPLPVNPLPTQAIHNPSAPPANSETSKLSSHPEISDDFKINTKTFKEGIQKMFEETPERIQSKMNKKYPDIHLTNQEVQILSGCYQKTAQIINAGIPENISIEIKDYMDEIIKIGMKGKEELFKQTQLHPTLHNKLLKEKYFEKEFEINKNDKEFKEMQNYIELIQNLTNIIERDPTKNEIMSFAKSAGRSNFKHKYPNLSDAEIDKLQEKDMREYLHKDMKKRHPEKSNDEIEQEIEDFMKQK